MNCKEEEDKLSEHVKNIGGNPLLDKNAWKGSWRALEEMYNAGILESIGVSNFNLEEMNVLLDIAHVKPHIYQGSIQSIMFDKPLMELLTNHNVFVQVYNIFAHGAHDNHAYGIVPGTSNVNHLKFNAPQYLISSFPKLSAR